MKSVAFFPQVLAFVAEAHNTWRKGFEAAKGVGAVRMKPTVDGDWLKANAGQPFCDPAQRQVNINIGFEALPADKQVENINSAAVACTLVFGQVLSGGELDADFIEAASAEIHVQWVLRQRALGMDGTDGYFAALAVPYSELPENEKEKDREIVRGAIRLYNSIRR